MGIMDGDEDYGYTWQKHGQITSKRNQEVSSNRFHTRPKVILYVPNAVIQITLPDIHKPIVMVDLYRSYRDSQLVGMSGYSKESLLERKGLHAINRNNDNNDDDMMMVLQRMASDMKKHMLDLNRWPIRSSKGTQFQLAMTCVDTNLGRGWYNSCFHRGPGMEPWRGNDPMAGRAAASNSHLKDEFVRTLAS